MITVMWKKKTLMGSAGRTRPITPFVLSNLEGQRVTSSIIKLIRTMSFQCGCQ